MSKFLEFLSDPQYFSHGCYIVAKESMTKEQFIEFLNEVYDIGGEPARPIETDWVHFHLGYNDDGEKVNQWWTGCGHMKGSKEVWSF